MSKKSVIYSKHIFLFPFRWDSVTENETNLENLSINKRININQFEKALNKENWDFYSAKDQSLKGYYIDEFVNYNEYVYFYDYVRDALYDEIENRENIVKHFTYNLGQDASYHIHIKTDEKTTGVYQLNMKKIFLHVFSNGVGLLSYHLENNIYKEKESILQINDFGRRIYPQFLSSDGKDSTSIIKRSFLADKIQLNINGKNIIEDFSRYNLQQNCHDDMLTIASHPIQLPNFILELFNTNDQVIFHSSTRNLQYGQICIRPIIDDRMFTICWFGNDWMINELKEHRQAGFDTEYNYHTNEFWYKYIFIDGKSLTCANKNMLRRENMKHTYERFTEDGTLWGVSRYSLVGLTNTEYFGREIISTHATTIYYQMVVLCLMQRASVLKYSNEVARISRNIKEKHPEIEEINESYLKFINKMYFREITAQDQGIELYDMLQENMRIEREIADLKREIDEIYQFASLAYDKIQQEIDRDQNELITKITIIGVLFLPPSLLAGILGINIMPKYEEIPSLLFNGEIYIPFVFGIGTIVVISLLLTWLLINVFKLKIFKRNNSAKIDKQ
ncbi:CorA family divalent cation transporter [Marinifilum sp. D737]|uniref:CorA family divalent cation transporter n=1 Tax=Marinifilum sp. D737 TaxID=2969628 RepID=UPI002276ED96|nr:CorA family divalent cation transporter [Marinifilum sp. D737]MCY1634988.1 CorA family divalent cation transporter [Marinifilum sp. D737]